MTRKRHRSAGTGEFVSAEEAKANPSGTVSETVHPPLVTRFRHKRRGTTYEVLGVATMQSAHWRDPNTPADNCPHGVSVNMRRVVVYVAEEDGTLWARPVEEFEDGRFEPIPPE